MPSEWKVSTTYSCGEKYFQVYRIRDMREIDHSGNREVVFTTDDREEALEICGLRNEEEGL